MQQTPPPKPQHPLPTRVQQAIQDYGFADKHILSKVVASRQQGNWYAVLVKDPEEGFWAVELQAGFEGNWEIVSDYSGPFESVSDFHSKRLVTCFR